MFQIIRDANAASYESLLTSTHHNSNSIIIKQCIELRCAFMAY